jgi:hypothetical protein
VQIILVPNTLKVSADEEEVDFDPFALFYVV